MVMVVTLSMHQKQGHCGGYSAFNKTVLWWIASDQPRDVIAQLLWQVGI